MISNMHSVSERESAHTTLLAAIEIEKMQIKSSIYSHRDREDADQP